MQKSINSAYGTQSTTISIREERMSDEFTYIRLLPLLESPLSEAAQELISAAKAPGDKYTPPSDIALQPLVVTALTSHSDYWSGLALIW
jgi:hypothetical protein